MKNKILLVLIFLLGFGLRFYQLGQVPSGFVNDEAAIGYNAYSLLKTGKDEFGVSWPIIFRSFGEGKLPVYIYLTIPFVAVFGLTEFAVRFPSALFGSLSVLLIYLLGLEIRNWKLGIAAATLLATMPWHIHFSRAAFEANLALFLIILGSLLWLSKRQWLSLLSFILAIFTYNAARIFVPLWAVYLFIKHKKPLILLIFIPWILLNLSNNSLNRSVGISIFNNQSGVVQRLEQKFMETRNQPLWLTRALHNKPVEFSLDFAKRYVSHFNPDFLFFSGDPLRPRYRVPDIGQNLLLTLPFLIIGLYLTVKAGYWSIIFWLIIAPLASAITFETPSAIRAYFMIVPLVIISALGLNAFLKRFPKILIPVLILFSANLIYYLDAYYVHAPVHQPYEWQGGYKQLVKRVNELLPNYDRAMITDSRGTAYIYFLFYNRYDPVKWQTQSQAAVTETDKFGFSSINRLENLYFIGETCPAKIPEDRVLYVCTQENHPKAGFTQFKDSINFDDGQPAFVLFEKTKD